MINKYITDSPDALAAMSDPAPKNIWINGSETWIRTGADYVPESTAEGTPQ